MKGEESHDREVIVTQSKVAIDQDLGVLNFLRKIIEIKTQRKIMHMIEKITIDHKKERIKMDKIMGNRLSARMSIGLI